ncbi:MAG: hypothetical protein WCI47_01545 [bacterium]
MEMSAEHKAKLAVGRVNFSKVLAFLLANKLANGPKKPGRKRSSEAINDRLDKIAVELKSSSPIKELLLFQEAADLHKELAELEASNSEDIAATYAAARAEFILIAAAFSKSKGIEYATWRRAGVDAETLKEAGIK